MRSRDRAASVHPRGKVLVLMAALMPVTVGGVAASVDTAVVAAARGQLQTASDAAALAAAAQLATESRIRGSTTITTEMTAARSAAITVAGKNKVLTAAPAVFDNPSNTPQGEIVIGYLSPSNLSSAAPDTTASKTLYNSVKVITQRDSAHTGVVPSYFSNFLGLHGDSLKVSSIATVQNYTVGGIKSVNNLNGGLLPIALDKTTYNNMLTGTTTDQYTYNQPTPPATAGTVTAGADGVTESKAYPVASGDPGNWGTLNVGVSENSTSILNAQILNGITPAQLATFPNSTISLDHTDSSTEPATPYHTFSGNPGISAGIQSSLTSIIGQPRLLPIYDVSGGNGNNTWFRVIAFAGIRILAVNFQGNPKYVIIQPALVKDATAIPGTPQSSWKNGGIIRLYLAR